MFSKLLWVNNNIINIVKHIVIIFRFYRLFDSVIDCGVLSTPSGGDQTTTGSSLDDTASFSCGAGFNLEGSATRTCQNDDTWSGSDASCVCKLSFDIINRITTTMVRPNTTTMMNIGRLADRQKWRPVSPIRDAFYFIFREFINLLAAGSAGCVVHHC